MTLLCLFLLFIFSLVRLMNCKELRLIVSNLLLFESAKLASASDSARLGEVREEEDVGCLDGLPSRTELDWKRVEEGREEEGRWLSRLALRDILESFPALQQTELQSVGQSERQTWRRGSGPVVERRRCDMRHQDWRTLARSCLLLVTRKHSFDSSRRL